jgi:hypothetical protein
MRFNPSHQVFEFDGDELSKLNARIAADTADGSKEGFRVVAERTVQRIVNIRRQYKSYASNFFFSDSMPSNVQTPAVAVDDYVGIAYVGGPTNNTPLYIRGGLTYVVPTRFYSQGAAWHYMDDLQQLGFNVLDRTSGQIAEEMGKKIDTTLLALLDAAIPSAQKLTASTLDFPTWKAVIADASTAGFPVSNVVMSQARAMDMAEWETGTADVNWIWAPMPGNYGTEIARQGFVSNFMGVRAQIEWSIPDTTAYFFGDPATAGRILYSIGGMRRLTDTDIDNKTVRYNWDQLFEVYCASAYDCWKLTFTD